MNIRYTSAALDDLRIALEYLFERNPDAAEKLAVRIERTVEMLAEGWFDGPETRVGDERVRSWAVPPMRIYYLREPDGTLLVLRVYDQRRGPIPKS
jgi:plasmid stabilization system protein ParE